MTICAWTKHSSTQTADTLANTKPLHFSRILNHLPYLLQIRHARKVFCRVFWLIFFKEIIFDISSHDANKHERNGISQILNSVN